jgi:predicted NUDIX family phosphoesterase
MEQVFAVRRADFFAGRWPQGFVALSADEGAELLARFEQQGFFAERPAAEENPAWKQLIPYCVLARAEQLFCVERQRTQGERRLHGLLSIGLGGHVNPEDGRGEGLLYRALRRELDEELDIDWTRACGPAALLGLLNDDGNAVGQVHAGLVFRLDFPATEPGAPGCDPVSIRETTAMQGCFRHLVDSHGLWQDPARFESWSRILLEAGISGPKAASSSQRRQVDWSGSGREEPANG